MYKQLIAYKTKHGNTKVPRRYDQDPKLGEWVSNQRRNYKLGNMSKERTTLLDSIDFDWVIGEELESNPLLVPLIPLLERLLLILEEGQPKKSKML